MESADENIADKEPSTNEVLCEQEGYYYEAYSELMVHEGMLKDNSRTLAYKRAIEMNKHLIKVSARTPYTSGKTPSYNP